MGRNRRKWKKVGRKQVYQKKKRFWKADLNSSYCPPLSFHHCGVGTAELWGDPPISRVAAARQKQMGWSPRRRKGTCSLLGLKKSRLPGGSKPTGARLPSPLSIYHSIEKLKLGNSFKQQAAAVIFLSLISYMLLRSYVTSCNKDVRYSSNKSEMLSPLLILSCSSAIPN